MNIVLLCCTLQWVTTTLCCNPETNIDIYTNAYRIGLWIFRESMPLKGFHRTKNTVGCLKLSTVRPK